MGDKLGYCNSPYAKSAAAAGIKEKRSFEYECYKGSTLIRMCDWLD